MVIIFGINTACEAGRKWTLLICPNCGTEYPPEITNCPLCDASMKEISSSKEVPQQEGTQLLELAHFRTMAEADMIRELLEANGIRTVVRGEADPIGGIELPTILVEQRNFDYAGEIYNLYFAGESAENGNASID
jgi:hypothetical protein